MKMKNILIVQLGSLLLASSLQAKECIDIQKIDIGWTSYKTMAKIGVSGTFNDVQFSKPKNTATLQSALEGTSVTLNMKNIDAKAAIKTNNILKFFAPKLAEQSIKAKIVTIKEKYLTIEIILNGKKQLIPMKYTLDDAILVANGTIDGRDFALESALKSLNTNVAGHQNKGWLDIDISFELIYTNLCK